MIAIKGILLNQEISIPEIAINNGGEVTKTASIPFGVLKKKSQNSEMNPISGSKF